MAKFKNDEGEEVEAFSQEEVDAKIKTETERIEGETAAKIAEKDTAITAAQKERDDAKTALEEAAKGGDGKGSENYKTLKAALDAKDAKLTEYKNDLDSVKNQRVEDIKNSVLDQVAGKDAELRKKIEHHFTTTLKGVAATTPEEIKAKVENARKLSLNLDIPNPLDNLGGGGPGIGHENEGKGLEFSTREKALGGKLGIDDKDYKKYSGDPRLKNMLKK